MNPTFIGYLVVFVGGGIGASARHAINRLLGSTGGSFPYWTLIVNVLGCFIMGVLTGWFAHRGEATSQHVRLMLTTGVLGGFTTFSAFSLDAALLWQRHDVMGFALYVLGTVMLCLVSVFAGLILLRAMFAT